jgi:hypothetical protein
MLTLKRLFVILALSAAGFAGVPASAFVITRVNSNRAGLGTDGLADRGRCQINNLEKREMNMVDGNAIYQVTPIKLQDPAIPHAKNQIQELTERAVGSTAEFPSDRSVVNYWAQTKGSEPRLLLLSIQDGKVVAKDSSRAAQTLVKILDRNCFSLSK